MTNREINEIMKSEVRKERQATIKILRLIALAEDQKLDLELGYPSIATWLIKEHKYSEPAARRRISAAQMYRAVPNVTEKIESGALNLSSLRQAQLAIRFHEINTGAKLSDLKKAEVVSRIENKTGDQTERELIAIFPDLASRVKQERVTVIDENTSRLAGNLPNEALEDLQRVAELLSHKMPNASQFEIIAFVLKDFLQRNDPLLKQVKVKPTKPFEGSNQKIANEHVRAIAPRATIFESDSKFSAEMKRRQILQKAQGGCEFYEPLTGQRCGSRDRIQIDHIKPKAIGGSDDMVNLRALCQRHNLFMAEKNLGKKKANGWKIKNRH